MHQFSVHFVSAPDAGSAFNTSLGRVADILSEGLKRQGFACHREADTIVVDLTMGGEVANESVFVLTHPSLLEQDGLRQRLHAHGAVVIGSDRSTHALRQEIQGCPAGLVAVNAEAIADAEGSDPEVALLGCVAGLMPFMDAEALGATVWNAYDTGFAYGARAAIRAFDVGYQQTQVATDDTGTEH